MCYKQQLCVVFGLSNAKANIIHRTYPTMLSLCMAISTLPRKEATAQLAALSDEKTPKPMKIGPAVADRLITVLTNESNTLHNPKKRKQSSASTQG